MLVSRLAIILVRVVWTSLVLGLDNAGGSKHVAAIASATTARGNLSRVLPS
jgi:hypothetical protein